MLMIRCTGGTRQSHPEVQSPVPVESLVNTGDVNYSEYFTGKTMRLDYFHSGNSSEEHFAVDKIVSDGIWPEADGRALIDDLNPGTVLLRGRRQ
ncbi:MAG: hypothetical protein MZV63_37095 [Marinilabiliales bacterium]|nr:hypothetical protein [Marinilabiliales bacterium]